MSTLPHANSRPLFQYRNAGGARIALRGTKPYPREIDDYVIDSSKFPARYNTVNKVLKARPGCALKCEACDEKVAQCDGQNCIDFFHNTIATGGKALLEIRKAGDLGFGVFATSQIAAETTLGEYLGELLPKGSHAPGDRYAFELGRPGRCSTASRFGNVTRFVNHHCRPNVSAEAGMYGKREVVLFRAVDDIAAGEQVCISYGRVYFTGLGIMCKCDDQAADHLPPAIPGQAGGKAAAAAKKKGVKKGAAKGAAKAAVKKAVAKKAAAKKAAKKAAAKKAAGGKAAAKKVAGGKLAKAAGVKKG